VRGAMPGRSELCESLRPASGQRCKASVRTVQTTRPTGSDAGGRCRDALRGRGISIASACSRVGSGGSQGTWELVVDNSNTVLHMNFR
jgi:hypothetical protein